MARTRNLKPGFFKNEDLAECDPYARLLFAGLWTIADREGRLEDRPKRIKAEILPYDSVDVDNLLTQLARHGFIVRYTAGGVDYISIPTFGKNQQPHVHEAASLIPPPEEADGSTVSNKEEYRTSTVQVPYSHPTSPSLTSSLNSSSLKPELVVAPADAAPGEKETTAEKNRRKQRIPENFCMTDKMLSWAKSEGFDKVLDLEYETDEFYDYWRGRGEPMLDWVATWQSRIRQRAQNNKGEARNGRNNGSGLRGANKAAHTRPKAGAGGGPDPAGFGAGFDVEVYTA